ncbi:hypothetical protein IW148_000684 [Coemansia sp. RSA 1199]|nr:hypothetical protein IW148_000684 [Coemansia sp. RSA 1199]
MSLATLMPLPDYWCIQALLLLWSWVYGHVPMDTQILVHHILKKPYKLATDKRPAATTKKPKETTKKQATSNNEPAAPADK